jgi:hypothetical protein
VYEDPECTSREFLDKVAQHQAALALSVRVYGAARFKHVEAMAVATAVEAVKAVTVEAVAVEAVAVEAVAVKAVAVKAATVKTHTRYKAGVLATSQDNDEGNKE